MVWPAIIGAAAAIGGGLLNRKQAQEDWKYQATRRYQYAVQDAKAAGLHPLFALGAGGSPATQASVCMGDSIAEAGRHVAAGVQRYQDKGAKRATLAMMTTEHELDMKMKRLQIAEKEHDMASNMETDMLEMRIAQESLQAAGNFPRTQAFTPGGAETQRHTKAVGKLNRELKDELAVRTPGRAFLVGPGGGNWRVLPGISPQRTWEDLIGEGADIVGLNIGVRMMMKGELNNAQVEELRKEWNKRAGTLSQPKQGARRKRSRKITGRGPKRNF